MKLLRDKLRMAKVRQVALELASENSVELPAKSEVAQAFHASFLDLQKSAEFEKVYPPGTVQRFVWDDQLQNNARIAEGKSKKSFRYSVPTLKWALRRLIKDGDSSYDELSVVLGLPSSSRMRS
jgi:hypothetical protein